MEIRGTHRYKQIIPCCCVFISNQALFYVSPLVYLHRHPRGQIISLNLVIRHRSGMQFCTNLHNIACSWTIYGVDALQTPTLRWKATVSFKDYWLKIIAQYKLKDVFATTDTATIWGLPVYPHVTKSQANLTWLMKRNHQHLGTIIRKTQILVFQTKLSRSRITEYCAQY